MNRKPVVLFTGVGYAEPGRSALLWGVKNHPNKDIRTENVQTSRVVSIKDIDGEITDIWTENTHYVRI